MALKIVRFITAKNLTDNMPINNDVDSDMLKKTIHVAQEQNIHNALGTNLYLKIKSLVSSGDINDALNAEYKMLLDEFIIPVLFRYSYYKSLRTFSSQFTDKGVQNRDGEASKRATEANVHALRQDALNDAQFQETLMIKYICDKGSSFFPEYFDCNKKDILPKGRAYFSGIVYGKKIKTDEERIKRLS